MRYRIDGITHDSTTVAAPLAPRMFARLKLMAGMDISITPRPAGRSRELRARGQ